MNMAPWAKFRTPSVPRMMESPLAISASRLPKAMPLNAWERNCASVGIERPYTVRAG